MKTLLIKTIENMGEEGLTLILNEKACLNGGISTDKIWVSWDRIGEALFSNKYCDIDSVEERNELRNISPKKEN